MVQGVRLIVATLHTEQVQDGFPVATRELLAVFLAEWRRLGHSTMVAREILNTVIIILIYKAYVEKQFTVTVIVSK